MTRIVNTKPALVWTVEEGAHVATIVNEQIIRISLPREGNETEPSDDVKEFANTLAIQFGQLIDEATKPVLDALEYAIDIGNAAEAMMAGNTKP